MSVDASTTLSNAMPPDQRILVSEDEACALIGVSKPTLRAWVAEGLISPVKLPHGIRRRLYRRTDLETWAARLDCSQLPPEDHRHH